MSHSQLFKEFADLLNAVRGESSKKAKVGLIKAAADKPHVKTLLHFALHPRVLFYVQKIPPYAPHDHPYTAFIAEEVINILYQLTERSVTGAAAKALIVSTLSNLHPDDADVISKVLLKDLKIGGAISTVNKAIPGFLPEFDISLAEPFEDERAIYPLIAQPKIDGLRVVAFVGEGNVTYLSRAGRPFDTLESLTENILKMFKAGTVLDGEATSDSFLESTSAIKRKTAKKEGEHNIIYSIFDVMSRDEFDNQTETDCQMVRLMNLDQVFYDVQENGFKPKNLRTLPWKLVSNAEELDEFFEEALDAGWEGVLTKDPSEPYKFTRHFGWMKIKPSDTYDVEITGFIEGKPGGKTAGILGAITYIVPGTDDVTGKVGTGFSLELRKWIWEHQDELRHTMMEISAMKREGKGMVRLQHPRFGKLRSHKGERA